MLEAKCLNEIRQGPDNIKAGVAMESSSDSHSPVCQNPVCQEAADDWMLFMFVLFKHRKVKRRKNIKTGKPVEPQNAEGASDVVYAVEN